MIQGIVSKIVGARGGGRTWASPAWWMARLTERLTLKRARHVVCETQFAADFAREQNPAVETRIIRTPIRDLWFDVRRNTNPQPEILFVGWVVPAKGVEVLCAAFASVVAKFPDASLHVVGPCDSRYADDVLKPLCDRLHVADRVHFHGRLTSEQIAARLSTATRGIADVDGHGAECSRRSPRSRCAGDRQCRRWDPGTH